MAIATQPLLADRPRPTGDGLVISGLSKVFSMRRSSLTALDGFELYADRSSFIALLGPSGCGKSTVLRILAGLERPTTGAVSVHGQSPLELRERYELGIAFQDPSLLPWRTVRSNVTLALEVGRARMSVRDLLQLGAESGRRESGLQGRQTLQRCAQDLTLGDGLAHYGAGVLHQRDAGIESEQLLEGDKSGATLGRAGKAAQARSGTGNQCIRFGLCAVAQDSAASNGSDRRVLRARVQRLQRIRGTAGPSGRSIAVKLRRLPLALLVGVREQIHWNGRGISLVLCLGKRLGECADVGDQRHLAAVE